MYPSNIIGVRNNNTISQETVRRLFTYDNGELIENTTRGQNKYAKAGAIVGSFTSNGYKVTKICGKAYKLHRLIFLYHFGYMPKFIDHVNGDRSDNRIENLREATRNDNARNIGKKGGTTSAYKGVFWVNGIKNWKAAASYNGKCYHIGTYHTEEEAAQAYNDFASTKFGEFARLNEIYSEVV
jgi:hypothetical protein